MAGSRQAPYSVFAFRSKIKIRFNYSKLKPARNGETGSNLHPGGLAH